MASSSKYLVLCDMNGVLCYRTEEPVAHVRADLYIRRKHFYKRHGVEQFIKDLLDSGKYDVAIYSSIMAHNLEAGLNALLPPILRRRLKAVLDRSMNKPDPNGAEEWDTIRDMNKVWAALPEYGPTTTILLDNEARKFSETPDNGIVVPEFGPTEVRTRKAGTLDSVKTYLLELAHDAPSDIREYMRAFPYTTTTIRPTSAVRAAAAGARGGAGTAAAGSAAAGAAAVASSVDALADAIAALAVGRKGTAAVATVVKTADACSGRGPAVDSSSSPSTSAAALAEPPTAHSEPQQDEVDEAKVPPAGTRLRFVTFSDGDLVYTSDSTEKGFYKVRVLATRGLRLDHKLDYHLLCEEARLHGATVTVTHEPK